jgi:hypothetical protein
MIRLALCLSAVGERHVGTIDDRAPTPKVLYHNGRTFAVLMTMAPAHRDFATRWHALPLGTATMSVSSNVRQP